MYTGPNGARQPLITVCELQWVHSNAVGLVQRPCGLAFVTVPFPKLLGAQQFDLVAEDIAQHLRLAAQKFHLSWAVRN
jgi:hypothetical protein